MMVIKKQAPKKVSKPASKFAEKKYVEVKKQIEQEAKFVKEESKEIATGVGNWWQHSSSEEKIYTILGIIALVLGLYVLRSMIGGLVLIIVGILFVTGYFISKKKSK